MTTRYRAAGETITINPGQTYTKGVLYLINGIAAVALDTYTSADTEAVFGIRGVYELPLEADDTAAAGKLAHWDASAGELVDADNDGTDRVVGRFFNESTGDNAEVLLVPPVNEPPAVIAHAFADGATLALAAQERDIYLTVDTQGGAVEVDLPTAASMKGRKVTFVRGGTGVNAITIDQAGTETINGSTSAVATLDAQHDTLTIQSNGTGWMIVASIIA